MKRKNFIEKYSKYIPSKKFAIIAIVCIAVIVGLFIFFRISSSEKFTAKNTNSLATSKLTLNELMQKDSDGDGVLDWEEALWGTDKNKPATFNGVPDATYIENKKKELKIEDSVNQQNLTETDKFAREFFSAFTAMKDSGQVDSNTINNFSSALGQKIVNPTLVDNYTQNDVLVNNDNSDNNKKSYYAEIKKLFKSYQSSGIGDELDIVSNNLTTNSTGVASDDQSGKLNEIADAYQEFAKKAMGMSVPDSLAKYHLQIVNSANNTGISVRNMAKITTDPIVGLSGLSQYQKYSDDLVGAVAGLEAAMP